MLTITMSVILKKEGNEFLLSESNIYIFQSREVLYKQRNIWQ